MVTTMIWLTLWNDCDTADHWYVKRCKPFFFCCTYQIFWNMNRSVTWPNLSILHYSHHIIALFFIHFLSHHFESFTVATTTWLTVMEYLCHKWPRICSTCRKHSYIIQLSVTDSKYQTKIQNDQFCTFSC